GAALSDVLKGAALSAGIDLPMNYLVFRRREDHIFVQVTFGATASDQTRTIITPFGPAVVGNGVQTPFGIAGGTVSQPHGDIQSDSLASEMTSSVLPTYPGLARQSRIQGVVVMEATVGTDGRVEDVNIITGHPLLVPAAKDAVMQWTYRPRATLATARILINFQF